MAKCVSCESTEFKLERLNAVVGWEHRHVVDVLICDRCKRVQGVAREFAYMAGTEQHDQQTTANEVGDTDEEQPIVIPSKVKR